MDWHSERRGSSIVVVPTGPIDHETADDFQSRLIPSVAEAADAGGRLIIDFKAVDYMSSVGLRVLMRSANQARDTSVVIVIANLNEAMREIFQISRFDKLFPVCDSVEGALSS